MPTPTPPEHDSRLISPRLRADTLAASVTILLAMTVVQRAVGFVRSILICRWLTQEEVGQWDMVFSFLMLATPLAVLAIPACFGRYLEHYRQRGQLKTLITRTGLVSILSTLVAALILLAFPEWFSMLIFGVPGKADTIGLVAIALVINVSTSYFIELLNAMRLIRILSVLHFMNSLTFAIFCVVLVLSWQATAIAILVAYTISCLLGTIGVLVRLTPSWKDLPVGENVPTQADFWKKISPYILWVTLTSSMSNLFTVVDRYMIIHHSQRFTQDGALATVGVYFSSRIVPALIVSIAIMFASATLPHLSHDWERGDRDRVRMRLNLFTKLLAAFLTASGILVLAAEPLIFDWALRGKYNAGRVILPMTLTYCIWSGLLSLVNGYLLCAEKAKLGTLALAAGLVTSIGLNLVLLPKYGLEGAVIATTVANGLTLSITLFFNRIFGMRFDWFTLLMLASPILLFTTHYLLASLILLAVTLVAWLTGQLFNQDEKALLDHVVERFTSRRNR